ncbi:hypothetical protein ACRALDRAFT_208464 [Sodiomyces alcalophilus JCM 7366]|uniref:uncharacterized protein n=1 Tax=Sodiomyces alcalophilus JCM 7366 TaxID=591952 RepID=UPI0039B3C945
MIPKELHHNWECSLEDTGQIEFGSSWVVEMVLLEKVSRRESRYDVRKQSKGRKLSPWCLDYITRCSRETNEKTALRKVGIPSTNGKAQPSPSATLAVNKPQGQGRVGQDSIETPKFCQLGQSLILNHFTTSFRPLFCRRAIYLRLRRGSRTTGGNNSTDFPSLVLLIHTQQHTGLINSSAPGGSVLPSRDFLFFHLPIFHLNFFSIPLPFFYQESLYSLCPLIRTPIITITITMMDRSRSSRPNRRKTFPTPSSSFGLTDEQDTIAASHPTSTSHLGSPPAANSQTPQTASPNRRAKRQDSAAPHSHTGFFGFEEEPPTTPSNGMSLRKRTRTFGSMDGAADEDDENESYKKGSHNLRKRPKIDYAAQDFVDELPEIALPAPRPATRRRRAESEAAGDDAPAPAPHSSQRKRTTSRDFGIPDGSSSGRRKTSTRKNSDHLTYFPHSDDVVQDTIEVVGDSSDLRTSGNIFDHHPKALTFPVVDKDTENSQPHPLPPSSDGPVSPLTQRRTSRGDTQMNDEANKPRSSPTSIRRIDHHDVSSDVQVQHHPGHQVSPTPQQRPSRDTELVEGSAFGHDSKPELTQNGISPHGASFTARDINEPSESRTIAPSISNLTRPHRDMTDASARDGESISGPQESEPLPSPTQKSAGDSLLKGDEQPRYDDTHRLPTTIPSHPSQPIHPIHQLLSTPDTGSGTSGTQADVSENDASNTPQQDEKMRAVNGVTCSSSVEPQEGGERTYPWSHLTPYIEGEYVTHPEPMVQVVATDADADADVDGDDDDAEGQDGDGAEGGSTAVNGAEPETAKNSGDDEEAPQDGQDHAGDRVNADVNHNENDNDDNEADDHGDDDTPGLNGIVDTESALPTPTTQTPRPGSPAPASSAPTGANTPAPTSTDDNKEKPAAATQERVVQRARKQCRFAKLRDPEDFKQAVQDYKSMPTADLWAFLAHANETLVAWQTEWQMRGRRVDDFENTKRRAAQDAEYEKKTANLSQFAKIESYIEKDFELRGYRAPIKEKEEGTYRQRWQDRVMASAYGFDYDPHPSKIGQQDPLNQRDGIMAGRQLRSQPQQTAKAAEAGDGGDGLVVTGKRTRNPPKLYEGLLQDDNRSATPVDRGIKPAGPRRRGRPPANPQAAQEQDLDSAAAVKSSGAKKQRGPKGKKAATADARAASPSPDDDADQSPRKRKRGRQPKAAAAFHTADEDDDTVSDVTEEDDETEDEPTPKRSRKTRGGRGKAAPRSTKLQNGGGVAADGMSATSSSDDDDEGASTYGLRHAKRQPNEQHEADEDEDPATATEPAKKRLRINFKHTVGCTDRPAANGRHQNTASHAILRELAATSRSRKGSPTKSCHMVTFKHLGRDSWTVLGRSGGTISPTATGAYGHRAGSSAAPSAPSSAATSTPASQAGDEIKDYATMTKSEKMSASMKKRWMNGSMQGAVNKRKATLAAKKAAAAAAANAGAPTPPPAARMGPNLMLNGQKRHY